MSVWFNGEILESASVDASNAGSLLGWGVFTTIGVRRGRPILLDRHYARLVRDAGKTGINFEWTWEQFATGISDLLRINNVQDGLARATLTKRGDGRWNTDWGTDFLLLTHATSAVIKPLRLWLSPEPAPQLGILTGVKTTSYLPYLLSWQQAQEAGYDDALLVNAAGDVCETARANLFWFCNDQLIFTPPLSSGCLQGVGREFLIKIAGQAGIEIREISVPPENLPRFDGVFTVSAAAGPRPVERYRGVGMERRLPAGAIEQVNVIKQLWDEAVDSHS